MSILETIRQPHDLTKLSDEQLRQLADEIRAFLVANISQTGGHLGPNLGVVELTMAMHRVFDSPRDHFIFDTGHQSYVHKILTGRHSFDTLRQEGGLSGYPERAESEHDVVENSHASASLSWADGISLAHKLQGENDRTTVALIGDGALTGGMAWEALNNIAADKERSVVIIVNDNGRSYAPTVGGLADKLDMLRRGFLDKIRTHKAYEDTLDFWKLRLQESGAPGRAMYRSLHAAKKGIKDLWAPQGLFEDLGLKYIGLVNGHDIAELEQALKDAKNYDGPVLVHTITEKGHGFEPAVADLNDQFHAVGVIDPVTGEPKRSGKGGTAWTKVFEEEINAIAEENEKIVAITGAMRKPVGLGTMSENFPDRVFDVGIAEQHAVTAAAGLAYGGLHPVVAIYATFLNRAFDQVLMDVALHQAGVTFVLDRAGVTGPDGASHHGMWDLAILQVVPGIMIAAPRDAARLKEELREAVQINDRPTVIRFPRGNVGEELVAQHRFGDGVDVLYQDSPINLADEKQIADVLIIGVGTMSEMALDIRRRLSDQGITATVIDPRWVLPVAESVIALAARHRLVVCIEDGVKTGGVGSRIRQEMRAKGVDTALNEVGLPAQFLAHGTREQVLSRVGLTAKQITRDTVDQVLGTRVPFARPLPHEDTPIGNIPKIHKA